MLTEEGQDRGRRSKGEVRVTAFLTIQKLQGGKHMCPLSIPVDPRQGLPSGFVLQEQSWGNPGYYRGTCHFRGGGKLILVLKPALESRRRWGDGGETGGDGVAFSPKSGLGVRKSTGRGT